MNRGKRKNKSSIARVIISDYNQKHIKEIKVIHEKRALLDTFYIKEMKYVDNKIEFQNVLSLDEENKVNIEDGKIVVKKNSSNIKYKIYGKKISKKDDKIVIEVMLEIENHDSEHYDSDRRSRKTKTERHLLSENKVDIYRKLFRVDSVSSKDIYKINRFLEYRNQFLLYYSALNKLFTEIFVHTDNYKNDIYKFKDDHFLELAINIKNEDNKLLGEFFKQKYNGVNEEILKEEIKKMINLYASLRHAAAHFHFDIFNQLYENKDITIKNGEYSSTLSHSLSLSVFKHLQEQKVTIETKRNEITKNENIEVLSQKISARYLYDLYWKICNRKNGFNKFVNGFFYKNGVEIKDNKEIINRHKFKYLDASVDSTTKYYEDINYCKEYKVLYNLHKEKIVEKHSCQSNGMELFKINQEINDIKLKMRELANKNAIIRMNYKVQIAFGFLFKEFKTINTNKGKRYENIDIKKFLHEFNTKDNLEKYYGNFDSYLDTKTTNRSIFKKGIKISENNYSVLFNDNPENNLLKFNALTILLLPQEMKGNYLGDVKKYYYDIKNFENDDLNFYHNLRLFEKNYKKFNFFNVELFSKLNDVDFKEFTDSISLLSFSTMNQLDLTNDEIQLKINEKRKDIYKQFINMAYNAIFVILKNIFAVINDYEINILLNASLMSGKSVEEVIQQSKNGDYYNFYKLLDNNKNILKPNFSYINEVRKKIAHLNFKELFLIENQKIQLLEDLTQIDLYFSEDNEDYAYGFSKKASHQVVLLKQEFYNDFLMRNAQYLMKLQKDYTEYCNINLKDNQCKWITGDLIKDADHINEILNFTEERYRGMLKKSKDTANKEIKNYYEYIKKLNTIHFKKRFFDSIFQHDNFKKIFQRMVKKSK